MSFSKILSELDPVSSSFPPQSTSSNGASVVTSWQQRRNLPELLATRQTYGKIGCLGRHAGITTSLMSYHGAWNPRRMQNMILAVGPSTPASIVMNASVSVAQSSSDSSSSSSHSEVAAVNDNGSDSNDEDSRIDEEEEDDSGMHEDGNQPRGRNRWARRDQNQSDDDSDTSPSARQMVDGALLDWFAGGSDSEVDRGHVMANSIRMAPSPSMRHGGCINTAAWIDCGWRISTAGCSTEAVPCEDCPTQLITSGDDHLVKFWDVREGMGSTTPLPGGFSTLCPFSAPACPNREEASIWWKEHYAKRKTRHVAGTVLPQAILHTGHRGNVFHATPIAGKPGKVATCGADGYLRITDLQSGDSSVIVSPEFEDDLGGILPAGLLSLRAGMCFSHHFLNANTGLLCSERGLRRFDVRLPPREQPTRSLLGGRFRACKACAILSSPESVSSLEEGDSVYVFAGGSSADVTLCDLRMADGASQRAVQRYRPSTLMPSDNVSVSGLDLSRDKQELLVSYESDQIYTFPVFPSIKSCIGPTLDEMREIASATEGQNASVVKELAAYGGHLNRFTFLKNAKYAGPRDEYICTGSDSGHAWIYEKSTGSVVSFLKADNSTCNGVLPHPTLPIFVTYGIDSTAKLWRATNPVDPEVDDSPKGRLKCSQDSPYEMSPTVRKWGEVQQILKILGSELECQKSYILPDNIPSAKVIVERGMFGLRGGSQRHGEVPRICNDLHNLPNVLKHNLYACIRSLVDGDDVPVESDIDNLKHRISIMRLRHQADRLGLQWNPHTPWFEESPDAEIVHSADIFPDAPSDWIPYDPEMCKSPWDFKNYFNTEDYAEILPAFQSLSAAKLVTLAERRERAQGSNCKDGEMTQTAESENGEPMVIHKEPSLTDSAVPSTTKMNVCSFEEDAEDESKYVFTGRNLLRRTLVSLKDAGNEALKAKNLDLAARRYDKAIQYGAVASMVFPSGNLDFANGRKEMLRANGGLHLEWTPLVKVLVICRLNLALLMLKPHFGHPDHAGEQSRLALRELRPFCRQKGKVMKGSKMNVLLHDNEPEETYIQAIGLQAKAYFRLGCSHHDMGDYEEAIRFFDSSLKSTELSNSVPDNLVLRRLSQAKRENKRKSKRQKRFKFSFTDSGGQEDESHESS